MKQLKKLIVFIIAMGVLILFLFIIENKKEETEYSDVFFGNIEPATAHSPPIS